MWKAIAGVILAVAFIHAQALKDLLLPQTRHIVGMVVDTQGNPVVEAHIDHTNDRRHAYQTNSSGRFELDTRAPTLVIRKAGFRSEFVRTQDENGLRITLQKLDNTPHFPTCLENGSYDGLKEWGGAFQFLRISDVKASPERHDVDYGIRSYYVETKSGPKGIRHGSGYMWDFGMPQDSDVWRSVKYAEIGYDFRDRTIIDARGQMANGRWWRYLGALGESASYSDVGEVDAKKLDRFLDGACWKPRPPR